MNQPRGRGGGAVRSRSTRIRIRRSRRSRQSRTEFWSCRLSKMVPAGGRGVAADVEQLVTDEGESGNSLSALVAPGLFGHENGRPARARWALPSPAPCGRGRGYV
jgi:hypothetical protein